MARPYRNLNQFVATAPDIIGKVLFVDSSYGSSLNLTSIHPYYPMAVTLDAAINECAADEAATIYLMPNHAETLSSASALTLDVAGVKVIGLGWGAARPTFTFDTAITASLVISAANVWLENIIFANGFDNMTAPINIQAADCTFVDVETRDNDSNYHCDDFILTTDAADRLRIFNWVHRANGGKTGPQTAISIVGGEDIEIQPKLIDGDFATACIEQLTTAGSLHVYGSADEPAYLRTRNSADVIVTCKSDTQGHIGPFINARVKDHAANITEAFVGADISFFQPIYIVNLDGERGMETNITASTDT